jgi:GntR family histidine utilization transcriptional repressor
LYGDINGGTTVSAKEAVAPGPPYARVKQFIIDGIKAGQWVDGARLPSEHELMKTFRVSRMTVHRALRELAAEGLLARIPGVGTFLSPPEIRSEYFRVQDIASDIVSRGHAHRAKLVTLAALRSKRDLASEFGIPPGGTLYHSVVVHYEDDVPIELEERFVLPAQAPAYLEQDFHTQATGLYLLNLGQPTEIDHSVFAVAPDKRTQKLLNIDEHEPCLLLIRRTWHGQTMTTKTLFAYPGTRYSLGSRYKVTDDVGRRVFTTTIPK